MFAAKRHPFHVVLSGVLVFALALSVRAAGEDPRLVDALLEACFFGQADEAARLVTKHPELANAEKNFELPLTRACDGKSLEVVKVLLAHRASPRAATADGRTVLWHAVDADQVEILRALVAKGADATLRQGADGRDGTLLFAARSRQMVNVLIAMKVDIHFTDSSGNTALHVACASAKKDVVEALLAHGADPDAAGRLGRRPIHAAAGSIAGDTRPIIELLLDSGADLRAKGFQGQCALHDAALNNRPQMIEFLIAKGLAVNTKSDTGQTPLDVAKIGKSQAAIDVLLKHGGK